MFKLYTLALLTISGLADSVTDGTKLISTILIHRHGDRTPTSFMMSLATDVEATEEAAARYGYGQLTDVGKQRSYTLGQTLRTRYNELLSPRYNKSEIYIRSTDSTRAKMTILLAMAAVYPDAGSWSDEVNWMPVPYTTVPAKYDFNLFFLNCPKFLTNFYALEMSNSPRMAKYFNVLNTLSYITGHNLTASPAGAAYVFYDVYTSQASLGVPLGDEIDALMPELMQAAGEALDVFLGDNKFFALQAGPMLNEFFTQADNLISGTDTPRVRIYSAHDFNVYSFQATAQMFPRQGVPAYASVFGLELRQIKATGEYVVLPVYQSSPGAGWTYLTPAGCDTLCPYDIYKKLVASVTLDEDTWRSICGFTDDIEVDEASIA